MRRSRCSVRKKLHFVFEANGRTMRNLILAKKTSDIGELKTRPFFSCHVKFRALNSFIRKRPERKKQPPGTPYKKCSKCALQIVINCSKQVS